jgi:type IV pilus assembly protein PilX
MRPSHPSTPARRAQQRGVALVTALIFLVILTLLGLSVVGSTTAEEKLGRNTRDLDIAFAAADAGMRDAELALTGSWKWPYSPLHMTDFTDSCTNGLCDSRYAAQATPVDKLDFYSSATPGVVLGSATSTAALPGLQSGSQPRYMIEAMCKNDPPNCQVQVFRITAQARGRLPNTRVVLQEVFQPADPIN